jgi:putative transposase
MRPAPQFSSFFATGWFPRTTVHNGVEVMSRISRIVVPHYPHHVTQRGACSASIFHSDDDRLAYLDLIAEETGRFGVNILAWCLMTDHVHFIAIPHHTDSLARAFGEGHRRYTRHKNALEGACGYLFQGRFASSVLDEPHLLAAVRYVESHPVRASLVQSPGDYPWSSARYHTGRATWDPLVMDRSLHGVAGNWEDFLSSTDEAAERRLRQATRTGRPAGDEKFIARIADMTGRDLAMGSPGRPRKRP